MTIEEAVHAKLNAVLTSVVGANRVYSDYALEGRPLPYVLFQRTGDDHRFYLDAGRSNVRTDVFIVGVWAKDRAKGWAFREAMFTAFGGADGSRWGGSSGVWVCGARAADAAADAKYQQDGTPVPDLEEMLTLSVTWDKAK